MLSRLAEAVQSPMRLPISFSARRRRPQQALPSSSPLAGRRSRTFPPISCHIALPVLEDNPCLEHSDMVGTMEVAVNT